ncbi:hypothetical protein F8388_026436 [Cannabis sativa]|uniref:Uncharacterized protein n=1 Tax=Cannabis sativa TaxID=3483 RepID=A0A7J6DU48_CANSA|nr:hypothetical protein G4B88_003015 [Cannabis sativa]KAF4381337.1 hypothetical protein F8388_026436 [Cannabis sativa]
MSDKIVSIINRMHRYPFGLRSNVEASKKELEKLQKEKSKLKEEEEKHSEEVKLLKEQGGSFAFLMSDQNQCGSSKSIHNLAEGSSPCRNRCGDLGVGAHHLASLSGQIGEPILLGFFVVLQATLSTFAGEDLHNMIALDFLEQGSHSFKNRGFPSPTSLAVDGGQNVAVVDDSKGSYLSFQTNNMGFDASSRIRNIIKELQPSNTIFTKFSDKWELRRREIRIPTKRNYLSRILTVIDDIILMLNLWTLLIEEQNYA